MLTDRPDLRRLLGVLLGAAVVLWLGRDVLAPFVLAAALAYAFTPLVDRVVAASAWPRLAVVGAGYAAALGVLGVLVWLIAGPLLNELDLLAHDGPHALAILIRQLVGADSVVVGGMIIPVDALARAVGDVLIGSLASPGGALHAASATGQFLLDAVLVLIVTFSMLLDGARAWAFALGLVPEPERTRLRRVAARIHLVLGRWLRGTFLLVGLVALALYLVLGPLLHLPYALALAILSGVLEVIPLVGPLVAAGLAVLVAFGAGGLGLAVLVAVVYLVVREVEDQLVMPIVIGRAVDLHPAVTIFAVLVGLSAFGILGGLLAVPAAAALNVTLQELGQPDPDAAPHGPPPPLAPPPAGRLDAGGALPPGP
ncbi:MAG: AI-2E family transporter [Candidatus Limnocylindrales bacterium]